VSLVKTWLFSQIENLLPGSPSFLMKFYVNKEKENHVADGVVREGSNNLSPSQAGEVCLDHLQRMAVFEFSGVSSALTRESSTCVRGAREICLEDREWLLFIPIFNVSMCGLGQGGGRRGLGKLVVAYRSVSFPIENISRLSECQCASIALLSLRLRCLGELYARFFFVCVAVSGRICFLFEPREFNFFLGEMEAYI